MADAEISDLGNSLREEARIQVERERLERIEAEELRYAKKTLYQAFHKMLSQVVRTKEFDNDPTTTREEDKNTLQKDVLPAVELVFAIIFTAELVSKCFVYGVSEYLSDNWNRLDFVIVCVSWVGIFSSGGGNFGSLRALRVLRPLRTVNKFPGLKLLITTLFNAGPNMLISSVLYLTIFLIYGCVGLHVWGGGFHNRCFHEQLGTMQEWDDSDTMCGVDPGAFQQCEAGYVCTEAVATPFFSCLNYDHLGNVVLLVFQVIALEGWTGLMYMTFDISGPLMLAMAIIFFLTLVILGGFLAANLFLAVIKNSFVLEEEVYQRRQRAAEIKERERLAEEEAERKERGILGMNQEPSFWERALPWCCAPGQAAKVQPEGVDMAELAKRKKKEEPNPMRDTEACCWCFEWLRPYVITETFDRFFIFLILVNVVFLCMEYDGMCCGYQDFLNSANTSLTVAFIVEMVLKIMALGCIGYCSDKFNLFDGFIVLTSVLELMASGSGPFGDEMKVFRIGRLLKLARLLRLLRVSKYVAPLRKIIAVITHTVAALGWVSLLMALNVFFFAILGMQMFGGRFYFDGEARPDANYDTFFSATLTVFTVITLDDWPTIMYDSVRATSRLAMLYYVALIVVGNFIVFNLLLAVMLTQFEKPVAALEDAEVADQITDAMADVEPGKGLMMNWEIAQDDLSIEERAVENLIQQQLEEARLAGDPALIAARTTDVNNFYKHNRVPERIALFLQQAITEEEFLNWDTNKAATETTSPGSDGKGSGNGGARRRSSIHGEVHQRVIEQHAKKTGADVGALLAEEVMEEEEEEAAGPSGTILGLGGDSSIRRVLWDLTHSEEFLNFILVLIIASCVQLAWETYATEAWENNVLAWMDIVLTVCFTLEMCCKILSNTFMDADDGYIKDSANQLDCFIVCVSLVSAALSSFDLGFLKSLRTLRCIRPLRVLSRSESMMVVIKALFTSIPGIANVGVFLISLFVVFGIIGGTLFRGQSGAYCSDHAITSEDSCIGEHNNETPGGRMEPREWVTSHANFDNFGKAVVTLLEISTLEGWSGYMHFYMNRPGGSDIECLFFLVWVMIAAIFMLNLFIGIVFQEFTMASEGPSGFSMLTDQQKDWVMTTRNLFVLSPKPKPELPKDPVQRAIVLFVGDPQFENMIAVLICSNVLVLMVTHYGQPQYWELTLVVATFFFNACFFLEAVLKIYGYGFFQYIDDGWNRFDLFLVGASLVDVMMDAGLLPDGGAIISVIRVFRIFRVMRMFRLAKHFAGLRKMASVLLVSLPSIINVGSLLLLFYFMFGILGCSFFSDVPYGEGVTRHTNFKNIGFAFLTLFRISTGEDWHNIMHDCIDHVGSGSIIYYVVFNVSIMFVLINVFVACVVDNMKVTSGENINYDDFTAKWTKYDPDATGWIKAEDLPKLLADLGPPTGFDRDTPKEEYIFFMSDLNVPSHGGKHHFSEVLYCLARRLGGVSLPESTLTVEIEARMKALFPVYQKDPATIITAVQRTSVLRFMERLKQ